MRLIAAVLAVAALVTVGTSAADDATAAKLRAVMEANLASTQKEDLEAVKATVHPKSMTYESIGPFAAQIFKKYELKYTLLDFKFLAVDGDIAIARGRQRTEKVEGPAFRNNEASVVWVFKLDGDQWKLYAQATMEVRYDE